MLLLRIGLALGSIITGAIAGGMLGAIVAKCTGGG